MARPLIDRIVDSVVKRLSEKAKYEMYLSIREDKDYDTTAVDVNTNDPQKMISAVVWDYIYSKVYIEMVKTDRKLAVKL